MFLFCCTLIYVHSSIAIILMGKRELAALLNLSSWCLVMVERLFLVVPRGCLRFVIVVFPDHTHLLFLLLNLSNVKLAVKVLNSLLKTNRFGQKRHKRFSSFLDWIEFITCLFVTSLWILLFWLTLLKVQSEYRQRMVELS